MDRLKTDFLCSSSSFLMGVGSVLSIRGNLYDYNSSESPDDLAISADWRMVGGDIRDAIEQAALEFPRKAISDGQQNGR